MTNNLHPNWRKLHLNHIRQLRSMVRSGRYVISGKAAIKRAQREAALCRARAAAV